MNNRVYMESLPAIVRARLLAPGKHLKPEEALAVLDICVSIGAEKAALAADRRAVLIIGNTGTLVSVKISPLAVFTAEQTYRFWKKHLYELYCWLHDDTN